MLSFELLLAKTAASGFLRLLNSRLYQELQRGSLHHSNASETMNPSPARAKLLTCLERLRITRAKATARAVRNATPKPMAHFPKDSWEVCAITGSTSAFDFTSASPPETCFVG